MPPTAEKNPVSKQTYRDLCERWQRCRTEDIPGLFYAFTELEAQTERIVSFYLEGEDLKAFDKHLKKEIEKYCDNSDPLKRCRLAVNIGLTAGYDGEFAPRNPHFCLMLQPYSPELEYDTLNWRMKWDPNPTFPTDPKQSPLSGRNAIPGDGAFLFVHHWLETEHYELSSAFESSAYQLGRRVKSYRFAAQETVSISEDLAAILDGGRLYLHLGRGISVSTHPFSFRPVLEVAGKAYLERGRQYNDNGSGDHGGSFFDYSVPIPPGP
ncbi:MAG: hypothetical protein AAF741_09265 [Bacteroidota bacterium]